MSQNPDIAVHYQDVCKQLDQFLEKYGYVREDNFYRVPGKKEVFISRTVSPDNQANISNQLQHGREKVVVIFCHLGAICIMLSHLLNIPFPLLAHGFFLPTTSLTILGTEERWSNEAYFRVQAMGDVSHLLLAGAHIQCRFLYACFSAVTKRLRDYSQPFKSSYSSAVSSVPSISSDSAVPVSLVSSVLSEPSAAVLSEELSVAVR